MRVSTHLEQRPLSPLSPNAIERMRLRCMKSKRKSAKDNWRLRNARLVRMGVLFFEEEHKRR